MKYIKLFKIFEAETYDDDSKYQRKKAIANAKRMMKVAPASGEKIRERDLEPYNPIKYTDVPLDVYLKRKEKGVENLPKKGEREKEEVKTPKRIYKYTIDDLRNAISNSEGMNDFRKNYPHLMDWYRRNKSTVSEDEFDELNRKDLEKNSIKNIVKQEKQRERQEERELIQAVRLKKKSEREQDKLKMQEETRIRHIKENFTKICTTLIDNFNYYENFKLFYPKSVEWIKENNFLEKFIFFFDYKEGVNGLEVIEFSDDLSSRLNEIGFKLQSDMSMSRNFNGKKIDIFSLRFKDIGKIIFLAVVDGNELPLLFTHMRNDTSLNDLSSIIDNLVKV